MRDGQYKGQQLTQIANRVSGWRKNAVPARYPSRGGFEVRRFSVFSNADRQLWAEIVVTFAKGGKQIDASAASVAASFEPVTQASGTNGHDAQVADCRPEAAKLSAAGRVLMIDPLRIAADLIGGYCDVLGMRRRALYDRIGEAQHLARLDPVTLASPNEVEARPLR